MVPSERGDPLLWLSDDPVPPGLWSRLLTEHPSSGLWPLLLDGHHSEPHRPWEAGELFPDMVSSIADHDPEELLARWWREYTADEDGNPPSEPMETAPYALWPGTAPAARVREGAAEEVAAECAELVVEYRPTPRLGLVRAGSGAEAVTATGWVGPLNYDNDTAVFAAVVADWERRFGVRVLGMGSATLTLSVGAPPTDTERALRVAAEHFAFCPDNIWQGSSHRLRAYAEQLVDQPVWDFWWD